MDRLLRFALCTAFHLAVCSGVGFLGRRVAALRTLPVPLRPDVKGGHKMDCGLRLPLMDDLLRCRWWRYFTPATQWSLTAQFFSAAC